MERARPLVVDLFSPLLFAYFFTLHADLLSVRLGEFTFRLNNLIALALFILLSLRFRSRLFTLPKKLMGALGCVTLSMILSAYLSPYKMRTLAYLIWWLVTLLGYFCLPYLCLRLLSAQRVLRLYFLSFICVGLLCPLELAIGFTGFQSPLTTDYLLPGFVRPNAFAYEPSYYALYMTPFVTCALLHYLTQKGESFFFPHKLTLGGLLFFNFLYFCSTATSAFFAYLFLLPLLFFLPASPLLPHLRKGATRSGLFFFSALLFLAALAPTLTKRVFFKFFRADFFILASFHERFTGIYNGIKLFLEKPYFGVGLGGAPAALYERWLTQDPAYRWEDYAGRMGAGLTTLKTFEPSCALIELLSSLGVVGLLAFAYLLFLYGKRAYQTLKDPLISLQNKRWALIFALSMLTALAILQINQGLLRTYLWVHFALTFAFMDCQKTQDN